MMPECPHMRKKSAGDETYAICDLVDKWCLLEGGDDCEEYKNFLEEEESGGES